MRRITHGDLCAAARALLPVPIARRSEMCRSFLQCADWADRYVKRTGRVHPYWGNGSLGAAARQEPLPPEPFVGDLEYCQCLAVVLDTVIRWRTDPARRVNPRRRKCSG